MIAAMPDFERIDRELAAIGPVPEAVRPLLDQYGQRDRSLENVDQVLAALKEGRVPTSSPPEIERPSFLPLGWDADRKSEPGIAALTPAVLEREEITVTTGAPDELVPPTNGVAAAPRVQYFTETDPPPSAAADDTSEPIDTQEASPPPPPDDPPPPPPAPVAAPVVIAAIAAAAAPAAAEPEVDELAEPKHPQRASRPPRPDLQALLEAELDPREFPSTSPPPPRLSRSSMPATSLPPLPQLSHPPAAGPGAPAQDGEFELMVDDDDILEIDEENE